jgi:hypothetical protein
MNPIHKDLSGSLFIATLASVLLVNADAASAQSNSPPPATATRPAQPEQTSIPNNAPPATRTQTTGEANHDATIRKMNEDEKQKVNREGK